MFENICLQDTEQHGGISMVCKIFFSSPSKLSYQLAWERDLGQEIKDKYLRA